MKKWILSNQTPIALIVGICSLIVVFLFDVRGVEVLMAFAMSFGLIALGGRLFEPDTSENWLEISYGGMICNVIASVLLLIGWTILLRRVLAAAIAAILLRMG